MSLIFKVDLLYKNEKQIMEVANKWSYVTQPLEKESNMGGVVFELIFIQAC